MFSNPAAGQVPVVRMFGVNEAGNSLAVFVHGFEPYFYVECPVAWGPDELALFESTLRQRMKVGASARCFCL